jgi:hypothetical protein
MDYERDLHLFPQRRVPGMGSRDAVKFDIIEVPLAVKGLRLIGVKFVV